MAHILDTPQTGFGREQDPIVYYEESDLERIVNYSELDVIVVAQVFLRFRNEELLSEEEIVYVW